MEIIASVGMPGSGKGEATNIAEENGFDVVVMGDVVKTVMRDHGLDPETDSVGKFCNDMRVEHGMDIMAQFTADVVRDMDASRVFIDGIRGWAEAEYLMDEFGDNFYLISIEAPFDVRFDRIKERGRVDDSEIETRDDLRERDHREKGWGMDEALENADVTVQNTGSLDEFQQMIEYVIQEKPSGVFRPDDF